MSFLVDDCIKIGYALSHPIAAWKSKDLVRACQYFKGELFSCAVKTALVATATILLLGLVLPSPANWIIGGVIASIIGYALAPDSSCRNWDASTVTDQQTTTTTEGTTTTTITSIPKEITWRQAIVKRLKAWSDVFRRDPKPLCSK